MSSSDMNEKKKLLMESFKRTKQREAKKQKLAAEERASEKALEAFHRKPYYMR